MLKVELHTSEVPGIFSRFRELVDERSWLKRTAAIKAEIRGNRFLKDHLVEKNAIAFALATCSDLLHRYGAIPLQGTENRALYPAISFAAQVLSIVDLSPREQGRRFVRRVQGAFRNPEEMCAIRLEMMAATHFVRRGYSVVWPEMEKTGTFDLLVKDIGTNGLEVECKSISYDKGRKVHRREALEFFHLMKPQIESASRNLQSGLTIVLTVPDRLPTTIHEKNELARRVNHAVLAARSASFDDGSEIRISPFDMTALGSLDLEGRQLLTRAVINDITGTHNREAMVIGQNNGGAVIFVVQSMKDDTLLQYVFDTVSQSAKKQVSGVRPAMFLVGLDNIGAQELLEVAKQDFDPLQPPTAIRVATSKFLASPDRDHVVGVGFLSGSALTPKQHGVIDSGGTAYHFPKHDSSFWHRDFSALFS